VTDIFRRKPERRYSDWDSEEHSKAGRIGDAVKYVYIIEKVESSYGAYVPDLPGCVAAGETREKTKKLIQETIEFHIDGLKEDGNPIPVPNSEAEYIDV